MIATQSLESFPPFGDNATKVKPDDAKYAAGFQAADVLPAEWMNWTWGKSSKGITDLNAGVEMMEAEINNVLAGATKTPDPTKTNQLLESIQKLIADAKSEAILAAHPIGSLYWSSDNTNPGTLFGGTWSQIKDKFILAAGDTYTNGATGGAATVTLTVEQIPSHNHSFTGSAVTSGAGTAHSHGLNSHTHNMEHKHGYTPAGKIASAASGTNNKTADAGAWSFSIVTMSGGSGVTQNQISGVSGITSSNTGTDLTRIAIYGGGGTKQVLSAAAHSHTAYFTGTASSTTSMTNSSGTAITNTGAATGNTANESAHTHSVTAAGTIGDKGGGQSHNNMPPYLVKFCWERTA